MRSPTALDASMFLMAHRLGALMTTRNGRWLAGGPTVCGCVTFIRLHTLRLGLAAPGAPHVP